MKNASWIRIAVACPFLIFFVMSALGLETEQPAETGHPLRLVIIGDSTVCNYPTNGSQRGWGQFIQGYFDDHVRVINLARSGRSTKTFIREGLWKKALAEHPDVVLIQFGHNDSHAPGKPEATDAATDYQTYLHQYISESRAAGAVPILVTPMVRRTFSTDGQLKDALEPYAKAMLAVGTQDHVPVIDLHASSFKMVQALGPKGSLEMANKPGDSTHFNGRGAKAMAQLVMQELPEADPALRPYLKHP